MSQANFNMDMTDFGDPAEFEAAEPLDGGGQFDNGGFDTGQQYDATGQEQAMQPMGMPARKKGVNIYTLFLILSLIFLIAGSIFLFNNVEQYRL